MYIIQPTHCDLERLKKRLKNARDYSSSSSYESRWMKNSLVIFFCADTFLFVRLCFTQASIEEMKYLIVGNIEIGKKMYRWGGGVAPGVPLTRQVGRGPAANYFAVAYFHIYAKIVLRWLRTDLETNDLTNTIRPEIRLNDMSSRSSTPR